MSAPNINTRLAAYQAFETATRSCFAALAQLGDGAATNKAEALISRARTIISCRANCGERT